ncbi:hypothetical protein C1J03_17805 [Sulfitobacter sp. SK012]|nr:hypothetical protein C1J03_17805 [Sulfitobacter sp. SK012]
MERVEINVDTDENRKFWESDLIPFATFIQDGDRTTGGNKAHPTLGPISSSRLHTRNRNLNSRWPLNLNHPVAARYTGGVIHTYYEGADLKRRDQVWNQFASNAAPFIIFLTNLLHRKGKMVIFIMGQRYTNGRY